MYEDIIRYPRLAKCVDITRAKVVRKKDGECDNKKTKMGEGGKNDGGEGEFSSK